MKYIFYILILVSVFYSCSYPVRKGYKKTDYNQILVLKSDFKKVIYRTSIDVYKKHFSGIMLIKKIEADSSYRIVFLSELGMKIFDFEFNNNLPERFKIHYILKPINKKLLINTLRKDFELFLKIYPQKLNKESFVSGKNIIEKIKNNGLYNYYLFNTDSNYVTSITQKTWLFKKLLIKNNGFSMASPNNVKFEHKGINLKISLFKINK